LRLEIEQTMKWKRVKEKDILMRYLFCTILLLIGVKIDTASGYKVIFALNCGGDEHVDSNGIRYEKDTLKIGTASNYGVNLPSGIGRVEQTDEILYQTERYHTSTFGYELPLASGDGEYVLILKFCEVYFNIPNAKVFDVVLNGDHKILSDLDIFRNVGKGVAHDEHIYFSVSRNRLYYKEEESEIRGGKVRVEFIKGFRDNPKCNAIVLIKGSDVNNVPKLPPLTETSQQQQQQQQDSSESFLEKEIPSEEEKPAAATTAAKQRKVSGPKTESPYSTLDDQLIISIFVGIVLFIPLLFCLCRL
jgi:hypothetical protein